VKGGNERPDVRKPWLTSQACFLIRIDVEHQQRALSSFPCLTASKQECVNDVGGDASPWNGGIWGPAWPGLQGVETSTAELAAATLACLS